jgi:Septum formation initiator
MLARVILWLIAAAGALFAVQGGEYSTMDLWRQRERKIRLEVETDSLAREVDSLRAQATAVQTDRATQERIAREEFGMVRGDKEIVYRFDEPKDSTPKK